jgi:hypothetical protein
VQKNGAEVQNIAILLALQKVSSLLTLLSRANCLVIMPSRKTMEE